MPPNVMLNLVQHLTASLSCSSPRTDPETSYSPLLIENIFCLYLLLSGKHVQGTTITDFLALQAPLERELTAVR